MHSPADVEDACLVRQYMLLLHGFAQTTWNQLTKPANSGIRDNVVSPANVRMCTERKENQACVFRAWLLSHDEDGRLFPDVDQRREGGKKQDDAMICSRPGPES